MSADEPPFFTAFDGGLRVSVRLTPKSSRDAIDGVKTAADGNAHLAARVRAVPENGKANKALELLLAKMLGVPKSAVSVTGGQTSRLKTVAVTCEADERDALVSKLAQLALHCRSGRNAVYSETERNGSSDQVRR